MYAVYKKKKGARRIKSVVVLCSLFTFFPFAERFFQIWMCHLGKISRRSNPTAAHRHSTIGWGAERSHNVLPSCPTGPYKGMHFMCISERN